MFGQCPAWMRHQSDANNIPDVGIGSEERGGKGGWGCCARVTSCPCEKCTSDQYGRRLTQSKRRDTVSGGDCGGDVEGV